MTHCDIPCPAPVPDALADAADPSAPDTGHICELLRQAPLFHGLAATELARLARGVREVRAGKGEILFHRGDPCTGFHLILCGQVKLAFISAEGNEKVVEILRPGQSFGEAVMFMEKPYVVMAQALTDAVLLHIAKPVVFDEMARDPLFNRKIVAGLAQRLHHLMADVESYSLRSGRDRIVGYLLREEEEQFGEQPGGRGTARGRVAIRLPTSKGTIASRLNLTQEHFSRILNELSAAGLIEVQGRTIHIPDLERLRLSLG
jgi:CRP-like cAMP-binding protein